MEQNSIITWNYATNFIENEKRWDELIQNCREVIKVFSKNTLLQIKFPHQFMDILEMHSAMSSGDRSEFLYSKAKEMLCETEKLEKVGDMLKQFYFESKKL